MRFIQMQAVPVRLIEPGSGRQHDEVEVFALGDDGKIYRLSVGHGLGWHEVE